MYCQNSLKLRITVQPVVQKAKNVENIRSGKYVNMKELLADNIALHQRMEEVHKRPGSNFTQWGTTAPTPKLREMNSPLSWIASFVSYVAIKSLDSHGRTYSHMLIYC